MAEGIVHEGKTLEQMEQEITCAVCQEHYAEPKVLPCLHYYCKQCVTKLATRTASNEPFSCPKCRKDTTLPEVWRNPRQLSLSTATNRTTTLWRESTARWRSSVKDAQTLEPKLKHSVANVSLLSARNVSSYTRS